MRMVLALMATLAASSALAQNGGPIALRDMGSFHVGGRHLEITGQPIKEIVFTPGGVPAKVDPNGKYQVEQMYAQYFLVQNRRGRLPLLLWHGGGLSGVTYETKPDGGDGWLSYFDCARLESATAPVVFIAMLSRPEMSGSSPVSRARRSPAMVPEKASGNQASGHRGRCHAPRSSIVV